MLSHHKGFAKLKENNIMASKAIKIMDVTDKFKALKQGHDFYLIKKGFNS
jgi:hypothetical protein